MSDLAQLKAQAMADLTQDTSLDKAADLAAQRNALLMNPDIPDGLDEFNPFAPEPPVTARVYVHMSNGIQFPSEFFWRTKVFSHELECCVSRSNVTKVELSKVEGRDIWSSSESLLLLAEGV